MIQLTCKIEYKITGKNCVATNIIIKKHDNQKCHI